MWTLIKREIRDQWMYITVPLLIMVIALLGYIPRMFWLYRSNFPALGLQKDIIDMYWLPMTILPLLAASFGVSQIYTDRTKKISAFLLSQSTSRPKLLISKLAAGLLWISCATLPIILADVVLLNLMPSLLPCPTDYLMKKMVTVILINLACYTIGLTHGWSSGKYLPVISAVALSLLLLFLLQIKGYGIQTWTVLILVTIAALVEVRHKFMTSPL